jgi:polysaccharide biosynthesis/export protein
MTVLWKFSVGATAIISRIVLLLVVLCGAAASAQTTPEAKAPSSGIKSLPGPQIAERYPRYLLQKSDVVDLGFTFSPEFNQTVTVQPDGFITLRDVGDLHVEGLSVPELIQKVRGAYSRILANPEISVTLKDFEKPYFIANGQVTKPGKYDLRGDTTLTQGIAIAGGFNDSAKHSQVVLYRKVSDGWLQAKLIDVKKMMKERDLREDLHLQNGDMIFVPQSAFSKIRKYIPNTGLGASLPVP